MEAILLNGIESRYVDPMEGEMRLDSRGPWLDVDFFPKMSDLSWKEGSGSHCPVCCLEMGSGLSDNAEVREGKKTMSVDGRPLTGETPQYRREDRWADTCTEAAEGRDKDGSKGCRVKRLLLLGYVGSRLAVECGAQLELTAAVHSSVALAAPAAPLLAQSPKF